MKFSGIAHTAMNVTDMDKALAFYCGILGFKDAFTLNNEKGPWIRYLYIAPGQFIELFYGNPGEQPDRHYAHLCLCVEDIYPVAAELKAAGVLTSDVKQGKDHNFQCWTADPDGNRIEIMQISPESPQYQFQASLS